MAGMTTMEDPMAKTTTPEEAAPENPFGDDGAQVKITTPVLFGRLHAEMDAALPDAEVHAVLKLPAADGPASPGNPAYLSWTPAALASATVNEIVAAHDPTPTAVPDLPPQIGGPGFAEKVRSLREQLSDGKPLSNEDLTSALALLIETLPPAS